jgi:hypothetical protein
METTSKQLILKNISKHFGTLVAVNDVESLPALSSRPAGMSFMTAK